MQVLRAKPCLTRSRLNTTQCWHPSKYMCVQHSLSRFQLVFLAWLGAYYLNQPTLQKDTMVVKAGERSKKAQGQEGVFDGKLAGKRETQVKGFSFKLFKWGPASIPFDSIPFPGNAAPPQYVCQKSGQEFGLESVWGLSGILNALKILYASY